MLTRFVIYIMFICVWVLLAEMVFNMIGYNLSMEYKVAISAIFALAFIVAYNKSKSDDQKGN